MRLDKFLNDVTGAGRSNIKKDIRKGLVLVNGNPIKDADAQIDQAADEIIYNGKKISLKKEYYYILHKPAGYITATKDEHEQTVMDLIDCEKGIKNRLFPVGRLDKDTEGLLLITTDGELGHQLLAPKKHVDKMYECHLAHALNEMDIEHLKSGVDIGEDKLTLEADLSVNEADDCIIYLTIHEGKFHQVKRMLQAVNNEVLYLKRLTFGSLILEESLEKGTYRSLTEDEIKDLKALV